MKKPLILFLFCIFCLTNALGVAYYSTPNPDNGEISGGLYYYVIGTETTYDGCPAYKTGDSYLYIYQIECGETYYYGDDPSNPTVRWESPTIGGTYVPSMDGTTGSIDIATLDMNYIGADTFLIDSWTGLYDIRKVYYLDVTNLDVIEYDIWGSYVLTRDLLPTDADYIGIGDDWEPMGTIIGTDPYIVFIGTLDGNYNRIFNFTIVSSSGNGTGFMRSGEYETKIKNIGFVNASVTSTGTDTGVVVGNGDGNYTNIFVTGKVIGTRYTGGLIGDSGGNPFIKDCWVDANITGTDMIGGFIGDVYADVENVYFLGNITGRDGVGGIVAGTPRTIKKVFAKANIQCRYQCGGIVAYQAPTNKTSNTYFKGTITQTGSMSAFDRTNNALGGSIGGIAGNSLGTTSTSYSNATITGIYAGGIISLGENGYDTGGDINYSFSVSTINGIGAAGIASTYLYGGIANVTNSGWSNNSGAILNAIDYNIDGDSVQLVQYNETSEDAFKDLNHPIYYGWDFTSIWRMDSEYNDGLPYLFFEDNFSTPSAPLNLRVTSIDENIAIAWDYPSNLGGSAIDFFVVERKPITSETWVTVATLNPTLTFVDTNLVPNISYDYRVSAINDTGQGADSNEVTADASSPLTTMSGCEQGVWYDEAKTITLTCADGVGSGCKNMYVSINGSAFTQIDLVGWSYEFDSDSNNIIKYYSVDELDNNEAVLGLKESHCKLDYTPPTSIGNVSVAPIVDNWYSTDINYIITPLDSWSDVNYTLYCSDDTNECTPDTNYVLPITFSEDGNHFVRFYSIDNVNNVQSIQSSGLMQIDKTVPLITLSATSTTRTINLSVLVNEDSNCRYDSNILKTFDEMNSLIDSNKIISYAWPVINDLSPNTTYTYLVWCRDHVYLDANSIITIKTAQYVGSQRTSATTSAISVVTQRFDSNTISIRETLEGMTNDNNEPLYSNSEIEEIISNSGEYEFSRTIIVERIVLINGSIRHKVTVTTSIKNINNGDLKDVKVVIEVPKELTTNASNVESLIPFTILVNDPILEFSISNLKEGDSYKIEYSFTGASLVDINKLKFSDPIIREATKIETIVPIVPQNPQEETSIEELIDQTEVGSESLGTQSSFDYTLSIIVVLVIVLIVGFILIKGKNLDLKNKKKHKKYQLK